MIGAITVEQDATNVLYPVLSPENKETGKYYYEGIVKVAKKLWDVSEKY